MLWKVTGETGHLERQVYLRSLPRLSLQWSLCQKEFVCIPIFPPPGKPQIVAISLETAIQNTGMAYFILSLSFPSPLAEIGLVPVISFFFCSTGPILLVVYAFYEAYKRLFLPSPPTKQLPLPAAEKAEALVHSPAEAEKMAVQYYREVVRSAV